MPRQLTPAEFADEIRLAHEGFNGAAVFQPRKLVRLRWASRLPASGFNGAAVFQPRKCPDKISFFQVAMTIASMGPRSFNRGNPRPLRPSDRSAVGVASMGPRSFNRGNGDAPSRLCRRRASMGPRSFNRGNGRPRRPCNRRLSFNGAAVFQPRKSRHGELPGVSLQLQWGRGLSTAEIGSSATAMRRRRASMGPRSFNRGNRIAEPARRPMQTGFNGAAVFQPRKSTGREEAAREASMGPRSFNRGNGTERCHAWNCRCFNGAAVFQPRKCAATAPVA